MFLLRTNETKKRNRVWTRLTKKKLALAWLGLFVSDSFLLFTYFFFLSGELILLFFFFGSVVCGDLKRTFLSLSFPCFLSFGVLLFFFFFRGYLSIPSVVRGMSRVYFFENGAGEIRQFGAVDFSDCGPYIYSVVRGDVPILDYFPGGSLPTVTQVWVSCRHTGLLRFLAFLMGDLCPGLAWRSWVETRAIRRGQMGYWFGRWRGCVRKQVQRRSVVKEWCVRHLACCTADRFLVSVRQKKTARAWVAWKAVYHRRKKRQKKRAGRDRTKAEDRRVENFMILTKAFLWWRDGAVPMRKRFAECCVMTIAYSDDLKKTAADAVEVSGRCCQGESRRIQVLTKLARHNLLEGDWRQVFESLGVLIKQTSGLPSVVQMQVSARLLYRQLHAMVVLRAREADICIPDNACGKQIYKRWQTLTGRMFFTYLRYNSCRLVPAKHRILRR